MRLWIQALVTGEALVRRRGKRLDAGPQIEGDLQGEVSHEISQLPRQTETGNSETLVNGSFSFHEFNHFLPVPQPLETLTNANVGEILRLILLSPAGTRASAGDDSTIVAKSVAMLCELDDKANKLMEIAFNKYPNLMIIRSDRRKTFIRWMFCSLSNLLQLHLPAPWTSGRPARLKLCLESLKLLALMLGSLMRCACRRVRFGRLS
ncbi:uncharacterized protein LOC129290604 isoform X2 [Prosopis cineraria]|uniref:uncharacterized protein LOC129290604 isoform X2 n=1 Tax=Prosopis cineraria TaxID=364024 RepID=UPI00240EFB95|nr:uncharacterized protein LOC129290604 isoform X2 [Prosopis cineraria]